MCSDRRTQSKRTASPLKGDGLQDACNAMDLAALAGQLQVRGDLRAQGRFEHVVGLQALGKVANVAGHGGVPPAIEAKGEHFVQGLFG